MVSVRLADTERLYRCRQLNNFLNLVQGELPSAGVVSSVLDHLLSRGHLHHTTERQRRVNDADNHLEILLRTSSKNKRNDVSGS